MVKKNIHLFLILALTSVLQVTAQSKEDLEKNKNSYNKEAIEKQEKNLKQQQVAREQRVKKYLSEHPNKQRTFIIKGVTYFIYDIRKDGLPIIYNTKNRGSGKVIKTTSLYNGGSLGLNIQGQGMVSGVWDGGLVRTTHQLLTGKATQLDAAATLSNHATHVTGTIIGAEIAAKPEARGIAFNATAKTYDWNDDVLEYSTFGTSGYLVSNHSYGRENIAEPIWSFGAYDDDAAKVDSILALRPFYLQCWAGGNEQQNNNNFSTKSGYDVMTGTSAAKNILTVGAVDSAGAMSNFSNWGPTDDGRIKPEICAKGVSVTSSYSTGDTDYNTGDGTSYASPAIAGCALLVQQYYKSLNGNYLESAGVKGLLLHTATDLGVAGPDYKFGWGLANAENAAKTITNANNNFALMNSEAKIATININPSVGADFTYTIKAKGTDTLRVSISWVDDAGVVQTASNGIDPTTGRLAYNFDIKVIDLTSNTTYYPWSGPGMANRLQPATRNGVNNVDNYKRVDIDAPVANRDYQIVVTKRVGSPVANRNFTLIATGLTATPLPVKISNYEVKITNDKKIINYWTTSTEINSKNFEIQHSADGLIFEPIGTIAAKGFASEYKFVDEKPNAGVNYYRLKQVDKDSKFEYSDVKTVNFKSRTLNVSVYPNPATNMLNVKADNAIQLRVYDVNGKTTYQSNANNNGLWTVDCKQYAKGTYFVEIITADGSNQVEKFIKK